MQCGPLTRELWSYDKVEVGDMVTDGHMQYKVLKVIEIKSPAIQGTHLEIVK